MPRAPYTLADRLAARAVAQALADTWDLDAAADALDHLAGSNRTAIEVALARVHRNLRERPSAAAQRAALALARVLDALPAAS